MNIHTPSGQTVSDRAREVGVSVRTLHAWKASGIDIFNDDDVRGHLGTLRMTPPNLTAAFTPQRAPKPTSAPASVVPEDFDPTENNEDGENPVIDALVRRLQARDISYADARTIKMQVDGMRAAVQLQADMGKLISLQEVREVAMRIGAGVKAAIMRFQADLPPMLEGLPPAKMQKIIQEKGDEVLRWLSGETEAMTADA